MSNIERDMLAPTIRREVHERLIDQATAIIEARERDMYEAMRERDEARQQLAGAVAALRKIDALLEADVPRGPFIVRLEEIVADALATAGGQ